MLNWLLEKRGKMTQTQVANHADITQQQYSHIENGFRLPSVKTAKKIANVLDFDWTRFFTSETDKAQQEAVG